MLQKSPLAEAADARTRQAQRMEIVGQLAGGVVHDFNNILTVIIGTLEILAEAVADRPDLAAIAGLMDAAATRGANLTSQLLAFSRGAPSQPRDVDVNVLLADAARLLRPALGEQIEIDTVLAADRQTALVDPDRLMTVILNLAIMARDAMPEGGKLAFGSASAAPGTASAGADSGIAAARLVTIMVEARGDRGSADRPDRIFADLDAVEDFIARSDGHIKTKSEPARGASVRIHLPLAAGLVQPQSKQCIGGNEAILIVEDDALVRQSVVTHVESLGYRTLVAAGADEALIIIDGNEKIDLLFTDVVMPGLINGRQLAVEAVNRRPSLKVLYTSGYARNALIQEGRLDAGVLLIAKPYRKADLAKIIRTALSS